MTRAIETPVAKPSLREAQVDDGELLLRFRDHGERAAFDELVHRYERELYSYLRRYVGDPSLAEDVFQSTFLQVYRKRHLYEEDRPFRPWLYAIATHQAVDALRKAGRHQAVSLDAEQTDNDASTGSLLQLLETHGPTPADAMENEEQREWIRAEVEKLPVHLRSVVLMTYYQGLKYREVAEALGIPVGTMKSRLHTALARIQTAWRRVQQKQDGAITNDGRR
jgi:RNA polymerase sigma-70 factor (ECF subfamily)